MNTAERTLAYAGLGAALSIALLAAPLATPGTAYADEAASDTAAATVEASDDAVEPTLVIGREGATVEVPCASEADPEALVAALAEETGWNLALATGIEVDETGQGVTIPLAEDSVVYTGSTEGIDAAYAGKDRADLVYTVLNSIAETIWGNTPYATVRFCAPDGGPIEIEEDGFSFYLSNYCSWYESNIVATNEPLPDDSLGTYWPMPIGPAIAGWPTLSVVFMRDGVEPGEGTIAIVDSEGAVVEEIDVADSERVFAFDMTEETLGSFNLKDGTFMTVLLNEPLKPNETYGVRFATGTFVSGDPTTTTDMTEDMWWIETYGFGMGETSNADGRAVVGEPYTEEYLLDDNVEKVVITPSDPDVCEVSTTELTESGTVTYTPLKAGKSNCLISFYLTDGTIYQIASDYVIDEA